MRNRLAGIIDRYLDMQQDILETFVDHEELRHRQAKIAFLPLLPHASYRRSALQALYRTMDEEIDNLIQQVAEQAEQRSGARLLMTYPGVGPVTALATDVFLGDPKRFLDGKALASLGLTRRTPEMTQPSGHDRGEAPSISSRS